MAEDFVGRGWAFPLRTDANGGIALVGREQELEEAMRLILSTSYGERPMRPEFGCALNEFVFAPIDATTAGRVAFEVRLSLERWEPRVEIDSVDVYNDDATPTTLLIDITYRIKGSYDPRNLVFPFYVIPPE